MDLGLEDVHVFVTGASGGIGTEITKGYLAQGARVTAQYNSNDASLQPIVSQYGKQKILIVQGDITKEENTARLFSDAESSFGPVQIIVANHAVSPPVDEMLWDMSFERWKNTMSINVDVAFLVVREYLRHLKTVSVEAKEKACIVLIGSTAGSIGELGHADYAASKSAIMYGLTMTLKNEIVKIAPLGRVNCVAPGWTLTPKKEDKFQDQKVVEWVTATVPMKKVATPEDIANQVLVVSSAKVSGHVSGQVITVSGGMEGRLLNLPEST